MIEVCRRRSDTGLHPCNVRDQSVRSQVGQHRGNSRRRAGNHDEVRIIHCFLWGLGNQGEGLEAGQLGHRLGRRIKPMDIPASLSQAEGDRSTDEARTENAGLFHRLEALRA